MMISTYRLMGFDVRLCDSVRPNVNKLQMYDRKVTNSRDPRPGQYDLHRYCFQQSMRASLLHSYFNLQVDAQVAITGNKNHFWDMWCEALSSISPSLDVFWKYCNKP